MLLAILGGALIGLSASLYWSLDGRIAGISSILNGALLDGGRERWVRVLFLLGLLASGVGFALFTNRVPAPTLPLLPLAFAGLLVGFGTRLAGGCTSGHGVCGLSRLSVRSLVAVPTFMLAAALTVFVVRHALKLWVQS
ncbi:MAG TPA: YeeE/YedE thiosulfate transporter family protein [Polyangiaceae bacterium]|nr:YeeE/YedE thiosulfate transporter family protein [Polyangiaceae bacterium]